jgi:hypothetical protein
MDAEEYFKTQKNVNKKRYDALRSFFIEKRPAQEIADQYEYTLASFYSLVRDFRKYLQKDDREDFFFKNIHFGRKERQDDDLKEMIISLRKLNFSIEDIVGIANSREYAISYGYVYQLLKAEGFARLPRRSASEKKQLDLPVINLNWSKKVNNHAK